MKAENILKNCEFIPSFHKNLNKKSADKHANTFTWISSMKTDT